MTSLVTERPGEGPPRPYRFPEVVKQAVAGGEVVAAHLPGQALAVAGLLFDAGAGREPAGKEGVASVVANALEEGTTTRDAAAYAVALESLGAELYTFVDWDSLRASVQTPVDRLPAAVELLAEAVRTPRFHPDDVARVRDDEVTKLRMERATPGPRADAALRAELFGTGRRHGRPLHGDPDSVMSLLVDDVSGFHRAWLSRPGVLLVAGDLDGLDLSGLGAAAFGGADGGPYADRPVPDPGLGGVRRIVLVDRPGSVQSTLRLGHPAPHWAHPDHEMMSLAGTVLGGSFTSRLNHLIREVRGYTYGIRAHFAAHRGFGRFTVSAAVHTAATGPALVDTVGEIARTQTGGVTEAELAVARSYRAGLLSVEMQTPGAIASALATLVVHDLPDDYHAGLRTRLLAAPEAEVSGAAAAHLRPDELVLVVEGDAAAIRSDLSATGLGEVVEATGV
ncbi:MAG TPA: pitrilysin family protein [Pilimelia sp.]|nr:pitrilysin family protein [Pilimelia sp.]